MMLAVRSISSVRIGNNASFDPIDKKNRRASIVKARRLVSDIATDYLGGVFTVTMLEYAESPDALKARTR